MKRHRVAAMILAGTFLGMSGVVQAESEQASSEQGTLKQSVEGAAERAADFLSDTALTARVKTALTTESALSPFSVGVESTRGVVTLTGDVASRAERRLAERVAADVEGVIAVHNALRVSETAGTQP
ncbi:BON domain-containing protein [Algiphilus sp.]|uniref:BON domain-containing protein n=1 Tax=Algiphilus sp. TaxID=1872431 RepID=UPI002A67FD6D|nr:BON domain-containing protein [Algiphilus sp.]MCR9090344.1 BON domain-containing protein [Pseudomonadota bacterium]